MNKNVVIKTILSAFIIASPIIYITPISELLSEMRFIFILMIPFLLVIDVFYLILPILILIFCFYSVYLFNKFRKKDKIAKRHKYLWCLILAIIIIEIFVVDIFEPVNIYNWLYGKLF